MFVAAKQLSGCLHVQCGELIQLERRRAQPSHVRYFIKFNRAVLYIFGAYICGLDMNYDEQVDGASKQKRSISRQRRPKRSKWKCSLKFSWIPKILFYLTLCAIVYLIIVTYFQYSYDFNLLRNQRLLDQTVATQVEVELKSLDKANISTEQNVSTSLEITQKYAKLLNPSYWHLTIFIECVYLQAVFSILIVFMASYLNYNYLNPFDYYFYRDLIDSEQERASALRLVTKEVSDFKASSQIYLVASSADKLHGNARMALNAAAVPNDTGSVRCSRRASRKVEFWSQASKLVLEMLKSGSLMPMNRSVGWTQMRVTIQFLHQGVMILLSIILIPLLTFSIVSQSNNQSYTPVCIALIFLMIMFCSMAIICMPTYIIACLDQIRYVVKLCSLIRSCICLNRLEFDTFERHKKHLATKHKNHDEICCKNACNEACQRMNANFLFALMHFKIFVAQFEPMKRSLGLVWLQAFSSLFINPILVRIHLPYLRQAFNDDNKPFFFELIQALSLIISCSALLLADIGALPICNLYSRCQDLHGTLCSLMAHITSVEHRQQFSCSLYDHHAISLLEKELAHPNQLLTRLMTKTFGGVSGSYTNLLRLHFWWGLIMISIVFYNRTADNSSFFSALLSDPLGVFK